MLTALFVPVQAARSAGLDATSAQYISCTGLVKDKPAEALKIAQEWGNREKNSPGALHCQALARYAMKDYGAAAADLEVLLRGIGKDQPKLWAGVARQAATSYNLAGNESKSTGLLGEAISLADSRQLTDVMPGLLTDRANIHMAHNKYLLAVQDMDQLLTVNPKDTTALYTRASAFKELGLTGEARDDINELLRLDPKNQEGRELSSKLNGKKAAVKTPVKKKTAKKSTKKKAPVKKKTAAKKKSVKKKAG